MALTPTESIDNNLNLFKNQIPPDLSVAPKERMIAIRRKKVIICGITPFLPAINRITA
jgi:hypothetical protein